MDGLPRTTISCGGSNPNVSKISHETTVTCSTNINNIETLTSQFKIVSEISTQVFQLSIGCQVTYVNHDSLETSLAGSVLLVEYDHKYKRLWTWLWNYGLSRGVFNTLCLVGDGPGYPNQGCVYVLAGCNPGGCVHESLLEETWSGRLLIQEYKKRPFMFLEYLWHDIRKKLGGLLGCMNSW